MRKTSIKKAGLFFIFTAVSCSLIAVIIAYSSINKITKKVPMLVANTKIVAGDPLRKENFQVVNIPVAARPKDAILPNDELSGLVALKDMSESDILRFENVVDLKKNDLPVLSTRLRAVADSLTNNGLQDINEVTNLRAAEIPSDSIVGMIDGMKEGDKIAVTSVYIEEIEKKEKTRRTETIFDFIHVLGIKPPNDNFKGSVVIALSQKQFEALALAREKGKFYIALMPFGLTKPENHPEILSELYVQMLESPENIPILDFDELPSLGDNGIGN